MSALMSRRLLLGGTLVLAIACSPHARVPKPSAGMPVILISVDTLRADRLPMYGYAGVATPHLDALRRESILYEHAWSHCPLTLPSHATVFTGRLPAGAGVRDNIGYRLADDAATLAELMRANGYATGGAVSSYVLRGASGIARGFDFWEDEMEIRGPSLTIGRIQRDGAETIELALPWLAAQQKPVLFFLHLYEPHTPYEPPEPYRTRHAQQPYDGEVAYSDALVGRFLSALKNEGIYDEALIVFFSDHGEGLGDHGEDEHGIFLYDEAIRVPLLVKLPGGRLGGASVETPVQLSDLFPTVLEQTATPGGRAWEGASSLLSFVGKKPVARAIYSETYYPRIHFGWSDLHSMIDGRHHFIRAPTPELYDLRADPGETRNLAGQERRVRFAMQRAIEPFVREAAAPDPIDPEEAAKLAALGYLGSTVQVDPGEVLPDPKEKIGTFRDMQRAFTMVRDHRLEEGLDLIETILDENPKMLDLLTLKSRALASLGRKEEAIEAARHALRLAPNTGHLAIAIANLALESGRVDLAEDHAGLVMESEPARAHEILARVWIARKEYDRAEAEARKALAAGDDRAVPLLALARVETEKGELERAVSHLDEAVAVLEKKRNRAIAGVHFLRGDVLARLGRIEEAEAAFLKEIELFPASPHPYRNLILLLVAQGRNDEATRLVFRLAENVPTPPGYLAIVETLHAVGDDRGARFWARRALKEYPGATEFRRWVG